MIVYVMVRLGVDVGNLGAISAQSRRDLGAIWAYRVCLTHERVEVCVQRWWFGCWGDVGKGFHQLESGFEESKRLRDV